MRFLADMGLPASVVRWLREQGHDAIHLREEGFHRLPDTDIFAKARAEKRILLAFDLDFGEIAALSRAKEPSVIIFRLRNTRSPAVIARLEAVLASVAGELARGAVVVVEESRYRVRLLPIGAQG